MSVQFDRVSFAFGQKQIMSELSLVLPAVGLVGITGPSGCGKTTFLHLLAGLVSPQSGQITLDRRDRVGMVFQEDRLLPWLTCEANLLLACRDRARVREWLNKMELTQSGDCYPHELSGGMRRRVALARALSFDCDLLLLDEPFQGMDLQLKERLYPLVLDASRQKPVVIISHDRTELALLADPVYLASGPPLRLERT
jgi:NitT/TauT family transport system ATP-binding protein